MTIEHDRAIELANYALHDSLVRVPGGSRIQRDGASIKPFGVKLAAQVLGKKPDDVRNMADPRKGEHLLHVDKVHKLMLEGMDHAWLEAVAHSVGLMVIRLPDDLAHESLHQEVALLGQGFGDLCGAIHAALDERGDGGADITGAESEVIHRKAEDLVGRLYELLAVVDEVAK